jgi:hypothetical protein
VRGKSEGWKDRSHDRRTPGERPGGRYERDRPEGYDGTHLGERVRLLHHRALEHGAKITCRVVRPSDVGFVAEWEYVATSDFMEEAERSHREAFTPISRHGDTEIYLEENFDDRSRIEARRETGTTFRLKQKAGARLV